MRFLEILKGGVSFKTKKSHWWTKSFFKICITDFFSEHLGHACSAANKAPSMVNYRQFLAFDRLYLSCNVYCDRYLFQENFFCYYFQKQPYADILQNMRRKKFWNIHRKTFVLESLFSNVTGLTPCKFISTSSQKRLQHMWLQQSENFEIFRNSFFMEHLRWLLLSV